MKVIIEKHFSFLVVFLAIFLIFTDQLIKYLTRLDGGVYICNENLAFGIKMPPIILFVIAIPIVAYAASHNWKSINGNLDKNVSRITNCYLPFILILSGALSNLYDRLIFGCVIDYIDLKFWPASITMRSIAGWPVFNLADVFISVGAIMLAVELFKKTPDVKKSTFSRHSRPRI